MTLKHRLRNLNFSLRDLSADLTLHGRKVAAASLCMPFGINEGSDLLHCLDNWNGPLYKSITPRCKIGKVILCLYHLEQLKFGFMKMSAF